MFFAPRAQNAILSVTNTAPSDSQLNFDKYLLRIVLSRFTRANVFVLEHYVRV